MASDTERATSTPSHDQSGSRVTTMLCRSGSGRPMPSNVVRPRTRGCPTVTRLKWAKSSGIFQGMSPASPITPLRARAATRTMRVISDSDGGLDARVGVVALDGDVLEVEGVELGHRRVEPQRRQGPWLTGELEPRLVEVVHVEVGVTQRVHEVADLEPGHLRDH